MSKIRMPIDTKSLYFNIKNDNLHGHTATVATPLKQGNTYNEELGQLLQINDNKIDITSKAYFINELIKHSKSKVVIKHAYQFNKLSVNGILMDITSRRLMYIMMAPTTMNSEKFVKIETFGFTLLFLRAHSSTHSR